MEVLKYNGGSDIIDQYIFFCKTLDEQRKLYPKDGLKAVNETIRICMEADVLTKYLQNRKKEVVSIMLTLYSQEQATDMMLVSERRAAEARGEARGRLEGQRIGETRGIVKGVIAMLKKQGAAVQDAAAMLQEFLHVSEDEAQKLAHLYW